MILALALAGAVSFEVTAQDDPQVVKALFNESLSRGQSYEMLRDLTTNIGQRLSGSDNAARAVQWGAALMKEMGFDSVFLQPVMVPHWVRGKQEVARIFGSNKAAPVNVPVCALGGSVGTGPTGLRAKIVRVMGLNDVDKLGRAGVEGKIVFFDRPMDVTLFDPFEAYSGAVDQRVYGPSRAAKYGAVGVVVRSMAINIDDYPHTGTLVYQDSIPKIPAVAISTAAANLLDQMLQQDPGLEFYFESNCEILPDAPSFNVVGELKGSKYPNEYLLVGGHLDSWDLAQGASDDGTGVVEALETLRMFKVLGIRPEHSIRAVLFMNEENGSRGATKYVESARENNEKHLLAVESDRGGFAPRGFTMIADDATKSLIKSWAPLFLPYGIYDFEKPGAGADVEPLHDLGAAALELYPDPQRYFTLHHTAQDTFDKVDRRELELGAAAMASLIYLYDRHAPEK